MSTRAALLFTSFFLAVAIQGRTLEVGEGKEFSTIAAAAAAVQPGDTVLIYPGVYREAVRWRIGSLDGDPITVRGVDGPRPVVDGTGVVVHGAGQVPRALFQVEADNYVFENLELRNARNGQNAAGFRMLNAHKTVIRNVKVAWNDMGFMSVGNDDLLIEYSEIAFNGTPLYNGYSHNFYLEGDRTVVRHCYIHDSTNGQTFKTRGRYTELLYNYIADAHDRIDFGDTTKEIGFQEGPDSGRPNAHAVLIGNVLVKRGTGNSFIDFGPEGSTPARTGVLFMINNTVIREAATSKWVLRMGHPDESAVLYNNIFYGSGPLEFSRGTGGQNVTGANNWFPADSILPEGLTNNLFGSDPGFVDRVARDYRLRPDSPLVDAGFAEPTYLDADGAPQSAVPTALYGGHMGRRDRAVSGAPDIGALELAEEDRVLSDLTISGRLVDQNGRPLEFQAVQLFGPDARTVMTQAGGEYVFRNVRPGGPYTVAPWVDGFSFEPGQTVIDNLDAPATADFTAPPLYNIAGNLASASRQKPITQAVIFLNGPQPGWTATGTVDGHFEFRKLPAGGTYSIEPLRSNIVFREKTKMVENLASDVTLELLGDQYYTITGKITDAAGAPLEGVTVEVSGAASRTNASNANGNYALTGLAEDLAYDVFVRSANIPFAPAVASFSELTKSEVVNFKGPTTVPVRGVMVRNNGQPIPDAIARRAQVRLTGFQTITVNADSAGNYVFPGLTEGGTYELRAYAAGVNFPALVATIQDLHGPQTVEVKGKMADLTITGTITDKQGNPLKGVVVAISGTQGRSVATGADGKYLMTNVIEGGVLTLTATLKGYTFTPANLAIPDMGDSMVQNFVVATP